MSFVTIARRRSTGTTRAVLGLTALEDRAVPASVIDRSAILASAGNGTSNVIGTSQDGRYVIFGSTSNDLIAGQIDNIGSEDLFWADLLTGQIALVTALPSVSTDATTGALVYSDSSYNTRSYSSKLTQPNARMYDQAVISADGRYVAFSSKIDAALVDQDYISTAVAATSKRTIDPDRGNSTLDVFRWRAPVIPADTSTGNFSKMRLVSRTYDFNPAVVAGRQKSEAFGRTTDATDPSISADGSTVSFVSTRSAQEVLPVRNLNRGTVTVTEQSYAFPVQDAAGTADIFVTDMATATPDGGGFFTDANPPQARTTILSMFGGFTDTTIPTRRNDNGLPGANETAQIFFSVGSKSGGVAVDPLGRYLSGTGITAVFTTSLNPAELNGGVDPTVGVTYAAATSTNGRSDVYRVGRDSTSNLASHTIQIVSTPVTAATVGTVATLVSTGGDATPGGAIIAGEDDQLVLFAAAAPSPLVAGAGTNAKVHELYLRRMNAQVGADPLLITSASFTTNITGGGTLQDTNGDGVVSPLAYSITPSGSAVAFASTSSAKSLVPGNTAKGQLAVSDANGGLDVFVKDTITNRTTVVSVVPNGKTAGSKAASTPSISADGRYVSFESKGFDYVANLTDVNSAAAASATNTQLDAFVRDLQTTQKVAGATVTGVSRLVSSTGNGATTGDVGIVAGSTSVGANSSGGRAVFASPGSLDALYPIVPGNTAGYFEDLQPAGGGGAISTAPRTGAISGGRVATAALVSFDATGRVQIDNQFTPFPGFTGELRVATADVGGSLDANNNAVDDLIVGSGPGGGPRVLVIDGFTGQTLLNIFAFEKSFTGGVNVSAGDFDGDGFADLVIGADEGGGARVRVLKSDGKTPLADFFAYEPAFRGGVRVAVGDVGSLVNGTPTPTADGVPDIVAGAGVGGGPRVSVFDGASLPRPTRLVDYFTFEQGLRNGVFVAAGDFNNDGISEIAAGAGPGGSTRVMVFDGKTSLSTPNAPTVLLNFFAFGANSRDGVRVAVKNIDGDGVADLLVGQGSGQASQVRAYAGFVRSEDGNPTLLDDFITFNDTGSFNGAWVG